MEEMVYVFYWVINSSASGLQKLVWVVETKLYLFQFHLELHLIAHLQQMVLVHMKTLDLQKENMKNHVFLYGIDMEGVLDVLL